MSDAQMTQERRTLEEALKQANTQYDVGEQLGKAFEDIKNLCDDVTSLRDSLITVNNSLLAHGSDLMTHSADISSLRQRVDRHCQLRSEVEHLMGEVRRLKSACQNRGIV